MRRRGGGVSRPAGRTSSVSAAAEKPQMSWTHRPGPPPPLTCFRSLTAASLAPPSLPPPPLLFTCTLSCSVRFLRSSFTWPCERDGKGEGGREGGGGAGSGGVREAGGVLEEAKAPSLSKQPGAARLSQAEPSSPCRRAHRVPLAPHVLAEARVDHALQLVVQLRGLTSTEQRAMVLGRVDRKDGIMQARRRRLRSGGGPRHTAAPQAHLAQLVHAQLEGVLHHLRQWRGGCEARGKFSTGGTTPQA